MNSNTCLQHPLSTAVAHVLTTETVQQMMTSDIPWEAFSLHPTVALLWGLNQPFHQNSLQASQHNKRDKSLSIQPCDMLVCDMFANMHVAHKT